MTNRLTNLLSYLKESPDDAFLLFAIAQEYQSMNEIDLSRTYFNQLREKHPEYVGLYYHLAKLEVNASRKEEALEVFDEGLRITKSLGEMHAWSELNAAREALLDDYSSSS